MEYGFGLGQPQCVRDDRGIAAITEDRRAGDTGEITPQLGFNRQ